MGVVWNPYALPGGSMSVVCFAFAAFVYFTGRARATSRRLALVLATEGFLLSGAGWMYFMDRAEDAAGLQALFVTAMIAGPICYLFLVSTLDTPLTRPLRSTAGRVAVLVGLVAAEGWWLAHPLAFIPRMVRVWYAPWEADIGAQFQLFWSIAGLVSLYAIACALSAYLRSPPGSASRQRAKFWAIAFITRDAALTAVTFVLPFFLAVPPSGTWTDMVYIWGYPTADLLFVSLLGYGILQAQLFDVDLRLKAGVSRGVLASIFIAVFFVVAQLIQNVATESLGYAVGAVAAGLLLFALRPLERVASRVADAAMPRVQQTSEYLAFRKLQVYRAALEGAYEDGEVTARERAMLDRLRAELSIAEGDATEMERDLRARKLPQGS